MDNKDKVRNFTDLKVWQKAHHLFLDIVNDIKSFRNFNIERILIDQIIRSSSSISANIAEGFNANSTKEYVRYLDIAKRTASETENWFYKIKDLKMMSEGNSKDRIDSCKEISKMLQGLIVSLKRNFRS